MQDDKSCMAFKAEDDYAPSYVTGPNGFRFQCYNAVKMAEELNKLFSARSAERDYIPERATDAMIEAAIAAGPVQDNAISRITIQRMWQAMRSSARSATEASQEPHVYGRECPAGMVQVEFVGVDPKLKQGEYGYRPSHSAFLEVWVDGKRFRIDVGDVQRGDGSTVRGVHIVTSGEIKVDKHSMNALDVWYEKDRATNSPTDRKAHD
jgi:hypothetical protein